MNLGELKARVQTQLGDESGIVVTPEDIIRWLNDAQLEVVRKTNCLEDTIEIDVEAGVDSYDLPFDFLKDRRVTVNNYLLKRTTLEELDDLSPSRDVNQTTSDIPSRYYIYGRKIYLTPLPPSTITSGLKLWYVFAPTEMVSDASVPQIPLQMHKDLVLYAIAQAQDADENYGVSQNKLAEFEGQITLANDEQNDSSRESYPAVRLVHGDY